MIIAVTLSGALATLAVLMLSVGAHSDVATARGRHWVQALHVAESGVEEAIATIQEAAGNFGAPPVTFSGATDEGAYEVTVSKGARSRFTITSVGSVRQGAQLAATRRLRVTLAPPASFENALFSFTTVETKNNDVITGDVWGNQNVILADGTRVTGSVTAATGYVRLSNGAIVEEGAWSGGFNPATNEAVRLGNNARIDGDVTASVTLPPDPITCGGASNSNYKVRLEPGSVIGGNVVTWGTVEGSGTVLGTINNTSCTSAPAAIPLPTFEYAPENYDAATLREYGTPDTPSATAVADFHAYVNAQGKRINGTFYINQTGPVGQAGRVDLTGVVITGDTTIITNTPVFTNDTSDDTPDAIFTLVSTYKPPVGTTCDVNNDVSECSMHLKNNFSVSGNTAVLIYSPYGPVAVKNNAEQFGVIYADNIQVKNNQTMTYDGRVERMVGFGPITYEQVDWQELSA